MIERHVPDRKLAGRKHAGELGDPVGPRVRAPVVVNPDEAAFEEERTQRRHLLVAERSGPDAVHVQIGALVERVFGEANDQVVGRAVAVFADARLGQLRETDREVELRVGVVRGPSLPTRFAPAAGVQRPAEVEAMPEALGVGELGGIAARAEPPELRGRHERDEHQGTSSKAQDPTFEPRASSLVHARGSALSRRALGQRLEVLLNELSEVLRHFVCAGQHDAVLGDVGLSSEPELEALEAFGDHRLQARQLVDVLVHARIVELPQRAKDLVELTRIDVLGGEITPERHRLAGPLAGLAAELADVLRRQAEVAAIFPSAAVGAAVVDLVAAAEVGAVAVRTTARLLPLCAVGSALPLLALTLLALLLTLALALTLSAILATLLAFALLVAGVTVARLLLAVLAVRSVLLTLLALLAFLSLLSLRTLLAALHRPFLERLRRTRQTTGALERVLHPIGVLGLAERA